MLPAQIRAARALVSWSQSALAKAAGVRIADVRTFETGEASAVAGDTIAQMRAALEHGGVQFIPGNGGGAGVRLKFTRREVKAIDSLENEGGIVAEDDV